MQAGKPEKLTKTLEARIAKLERSIAALQGAVVELTYDKIISKAA